MSASVPTIVEQTFRIIRMSSNGSGGKEMQHVGFKVITQIMHTVHSSVYHFKDNQYRAMINMVRFTLLYFCIFANILLSIPISSYFFPLWT